MIDREAVQARKDLVDVIVSGLALKVKEAGAEVVMEAEVYEDPQMYKMRRVGLYGWVEADDREHSASVDAPIKVLRLAGESPFNTVKAADAVMKTLAAAATVQLREVLCDLRVAPLLSLDEIKQVEAMYA